MTADSAPAGSPIAPLRASARGPSPVAVLLLLAAAVIGAIAVAVASAPLPAPGPKPATSGLAVASPSVSAAASANPAPSPQAAPSTPRTAGTSTVFVLPGVADPAQALGALAGCTPLLRVAGQPLAAISGADVDATAVAAGRETGWLFVPPGIQALTRVWLGADVVELARAAGSPVVAVGSNGDVWLGGPAGGSRWRPTPTPAGRTAWTLTQDGVTSKGRCGPWAVPVSLAGQRSITCAGVAVPACLRSIRRVQADTPGVPYAGGDMALVSTCRALAAACGEVPLTALAVPPQWAGTNGSVRGAAAVGSGNFRLIAAGAEPDFALESVFSPSLPLPTAARTPARCGSILGGVLQAAPWDPRVFWVGGTAVMWPAGSRARFAGPPALTVPTADGTYRFVERSSVQLRGSLDPRTGAFVACSATPLSAVLVTAQPSP